MGLFDFLKAKDKKQKQKPEPVESELKKALSERTEQRNSAENTVMMETLEVEAPKVYSPAVDHPLLTIQDRISKLEEIYRTMSDRIVIMDGKVATKQDIDDLKAMVHEDLARGGDILTGIDNLGGQLGELKKARAELTRQVDTSKEQLTRQVDTLEKIDQKIELLECDQRIIEALREGGMSTIGLASKIGLTRQYIWGRLKALQKAGYVKSVKTGRKTKYQLINDV